MGAQWYILTVVLTVTKLAFTVNIQIKFTAGLHTYTNKQYLDMDRNRSTCLPTLLIARGR